MLLVQCAAWLCALALLLQQVEAKLNFSQRELFCDDLLHFAFPDLCELEVTRGTLPIRGLTLVYWRYRNRHKAGSKTPLLLVHGGPAVSHQYLLPMKQQACRGRDVVFYDQVGTGESSIPDNATATAPWLFTIPYYLEEVAALVEQLGWASFHLFGHSWGTIVGQAYGLLQDARLKGIVLAGPLSDPQLYIRAQWGQEEGNLGSLPLYVQHVIHSLDEQLAYNSPLYESEDDFLTHFFTVRTTPPPDCWLASAKSFTAKTSREIYVGMQGPSEFSMSGVLSHVNYTPRLHEIENPVLLTHGRYDTMRPACVDAMYKALPNVRRAFMPRAAHVAMVDEPKLMNDVVGAFLDHVDAGSFEQFQVPAEAEDPEHIWTLLAASVPSAPEASALGQLSPSSFLLGLLCGGAAVSLAAMTLPRWEARSRTELRKALIV